MHHGRERIDVVHWPRVGLRGHYEWPLVGAAAGEGREGMTPDKAKELVGQRILVAERKHGYSAVQMVAEYLILEVAPSGQWIKTRNIDGRREWVATENVAAIEVLTMLDARPREKP